MSWSHMSVYDLHTWDKGWGQEFKSSLDCVISEFETSLGYMRPCLSSYNSHAKITHFCMENCLWPVTKAFDSSTPLSANV